MTDKIRPGMWIRCLKDYWDEGARHFTKGNYYQVFEWFPPEQDWQDKAGWVRVSRDDLGDVNGWNMKHFELIKENTMENQIPAVMILNGSAVIHMPDGNTVTVAKGDGRFDQIVDAYRERRLEDIPSIIDPQYYFKRHGAEHDEASDTVTIKGEQMPKELTARIMEYRNQGLPLDSLTKFWENLKLNPSFNSRQQLFKFLENHGHAITEDGFFTGYRGVTEDFKDKHTRTFNNAPGAVCEVPRASVDDNPNNTCSHGLHVGGYEYSKDFGPKLVLVKVHPKDVVAVPTDYNGQKMRVCRFEVLSEVKSRVENTVLTDQGKDLSTKPKVSKPASDAPVQKVSMLTPAQKRAHKRRYANNHSKRGPDGKFAAKKKSKKRN